MRRNRLLNTVVVVVIAFASATLASESAVASSGAVVDTGIRPAGEVGRLLDRAYETSFRSPNVYRSSRHFSPFGNVYRSSDHYEKRLAASRDAYHLRTYIHRGHHGLYSTYHRHLGTRALHQPVRYGYPTTFVYPERYRSNETEILERRYDARKEAEAQRRARVHEALRRERERTEKVLSAEPARPATQTAVLQRVVQPDGSVKVIITSVPDDEVELAFNDDES